jgi:polysaccharide export outer membrane protein
MKVHSDRFLLSALLGAFLGLLAAAPGGAARAQEAAPAPPVTATRSNAVQKPFGAIEPRALEAPAAPSRPEADAAAPRGKDAVGTEAPPAPPENTGRPAPSAQPVSLASTDSPEGYRVGPGDVLQVNVWQEPDASGEFKVGPDGTIHHYLVGNVGVAGQSVQAIAQVLTDTLAQGYIRDPRVSVQVIDYQAQKVFVHGEIARPGVYALRGPTDLLKLLLDAGGPTRGAGSECTLLQVDRSGGDEKVDSLTIDVNALLVKGDLTQNRKVSSGDVIYVHPREKDDRASFGGDDRSYFVLGEVKNPGAYKYKEGISAMTAILEAGGFSEFARSNKTKLVREKDGHKDERTVKMGDLMENGDRSLDVDLLPGDVIVVPKSFF